MRLFGRPADAAEEPNKKKGSRRATAEPPLEAQRTASEPPDFDHLGEHVAELLKAAEESAEKIRGDAREEAGEIVGKATLEADEKRQTADREARLARQKAAGHEEEANGRIAEAERVSEDRIEELQSEIGALEGERRRALDEVRELVSELSEVLDDAPPRREPAEEPSVGDSVPGGNSSSGEDVQGPGDEDDTVVESVRIRPR